MQACTDLGLQVSNLQDSGGSVGDDLQCQNARARPKPVPGDGLLNGHASRSHPAVLDPLRRTEHYTRPCTRGETETRRDLFIT